MAGPLRRVLAGAAAAASLACGAAATANPLEAIIALDVDNPVAFMAAFEKLQQSQDVRGTKASVWVPEFAGSSPATHVLVIQYDDYADYETRSQRRRASPDWQTFISTVGDSSKLLGTTLFIQRNTAGEGWRSSGAAAVFVMTVTDPAKYSAAFDRLVAAQGHPGSIRLMEVRAGGEGMTHGVVVTAPSFAALNEYLDKLQASDDYRRFVDQVRSIRTINTVAMYRRVKSWGS